MRRQAVVLGAGIAGLTAARRLQAAGLDVLVLEAAPGIGGRLTAAGTGPGFDALASLLPATPALCAWARDCGLGEFLVHPTPAELGRWVLRDDRLLPLPRSPLGWLRSPLLRRRRSAWRLLAGALVLRGGGAVTLQQACRRRYGTEAGALLAELAATGIHAGDPDHLLPPPARRGSGRPRWLRVRDWQQLCTRLATGLELWTGCRAGALVPVAGGFDIPITSSAGAVEILGAQRVVVALPGPDAAAVLAGCGDVRPLNQLVYAPVATLRLRLAAAPSHPAQPGFGFLALQPREDGLLGGIHHRGMGSWGLTLLYGGVRTPEAADLPADELLGRAIRLLDALGWPPPAAGVEPGLDRWRPGILQPRDPAEREIGIRWERCNPGLTVLGEWRHGVGVAAAVAAARAVT